MLIPTSFKMNGHTYKVQLTGKLVGPSCAVGVVAYKEKTITIGQRCNVTNRKLTKRDIEHTFWHEVVHAILFEMRSSKYRDEYFVDAFAQKLHQITTTARDS